MTTSIILPKNFNFKSTIRSHGWYDLAPFYIHSPIVALDRIFELSTGKVVSSFIKEGDAVRNKNLEVITNVRLSKKEMEELVSLIKICLRMDENFDDFYQSVSKFKEFHWVNTLGAGRLLRSPSVWEDVVKMIFTTNCSWALTKIMTSNLCQKLGKEVRTSKNLQKQYTFPKPEAVADVTEKYMRKEIRVGYRAPYILELAKKVTNKEINLESWRSTGQSTEELFNEVRSVKGIGPYAAGNLLKLLGHYDYLAIDSWCRKNFYEKHSKGRKVSDKTIEKYYHQFGRWRGLFFWMDLTQYWYEQEITL